MKRPEIIQKNVSLAPLTTLKIGGSAKFFARVEKETDTIKAVAWARENDLPLFVLGGGSNVLIADQGFDGLVLQIANKGISVAEKDDEKSFVTAQAGENWDEFVAFCVGNNLQGIECLSGIPGSTGASPVQNIGAYGQEISETIVAVKAFDREKNETVSLTAADCKFAYRESIFNTTEKNRYIVLAATFCLKTGGAPKIVYRDLQNYFGDRQPTLAETRRAVLEIRKAKSMVIDENDPNAKSAGSFFKNPVITKEKLAEVSRIAQNLGAGIVPNFTFDERRVKLPTAWLIEKSGFEKGFKLGNVGLSTKHTLALINLGGAAAQDIIALKDLIERKVSDTFGVQLKPEPIFIGFE